MADSERLKDAVMRKLRITYEDSGTDLRVEEIIGDAESELRFAIGVPDSSEPFSGAGPEHSLLLAYCFYEWNDALDEFWSNYAGKVAQCREKWAVVQFAQENEGAADV